MSRRTTKCRPPNLIDTSDVSPPARPFTISRELESQRIISLSEASVLTGLSIDTLRRRYRVLKLSPRRVGMRLSDVLAIGSTA
jgi:hypothetical protein